MKGARIRFAVVGCSALTAGVVHVTGGVFAVRAVVHSPVRSPSDVHSHGAQVWAKKRQSALIPAATLDGRMDHSSGLVGAELEVGFEELDTS